MTVRRPDLAKKIDNMKDKSLRDRIRQLNLFRILIESAEDRKPLSGIGKYRSKKIRPFKDDYLEAIKELNNQRQIARLQTELIIELALIADEYHALNLCRLMLPDDLKIELKGIEDLNDLTARIVGDKKKNLERLATPV